MHRLTSLAVAAGSAVALAAARVPARAMPNSRDVRADTSRLRGFSPDGSRAERSWEARLQAVPLPDSIREYMRHLSARPHHVGSPYDHANAQWVLAKLQADGFDAHIEQFDVLFPTPLERVVELVAPTHFTAALNEPAVPGDPTSTQHSEQLPPYNAYSADGDVTAPLVYVNYGVPADYDELARHGISVKGAIVIARYGGSWRGIKPKVAAEHGAVGCLIYSDPRDDGYADGAVFPAGPMRPADGVQRGSVADMPTYPGDPLTPGVGATRDAKRLSLADAKTLTTIPVLPLSYGDAQPLLAAIGGPVVPSSWRGGLPITYRFGPGPARVHLRVKSDWSLHPIYDVIATIPGSVEPDQWVIRGNHEDAWVNGAQDPLSGLSAELDEARALGALLKQGWRPRRTIVYAMWDGEEPGLLGSTEWVETHADELRAKAVAYLNTDNSDRGYLGMSGSHVLQHFINDVARDITDPETGLSLWKRDQLRDIENGSAASRREARQDPDLHIGALGSGSDYSPFLQHLGIASLDLGFDGETRGGIYHSAYDDFYWYTHFSDTSFVYGRALAQTVGTAIMRLADARLIPYEFGDLASTVHGYVDELKELASARADAAHERNEELDEGVFAATSDPHEPTVAPPRDSVPPHFNFAPLDNAADALTASAHRYAAAVMKARARDDSIPDTTVMRVNAILLESERALTDSVGLPGRPWYVHELYAPGYYTGYGVKTMPAVREAIEQDRFGEIDGDVSRVAAALRAEAAVLDRASAVLDGSGG